MVCYDASMKYYRGQQFVPMQGTVSMYYETDDEDNVARFMTVFPDAGQVERMEKPPMKKLFRPEMLESVGSEEFERYWNG